MCGLELRVLQRKGQSWTTRPTDLIARQKRRRSTLAVSPSYLSCDAHDANLSKDQILKLLPMPILVGCRSRRRVPTMYARYQRRVIQMNAYKLAGQGEETSCSSRGPSAGGSAPLNRCRRWASRCNRKRPLGHFS